MSATYDLTKTEDVLRWMRGGQYQSGYRAIAASLAQAMRITDDLRQWCNADPGLPGVGKDRVGDQLPADPSEAHVVGFGAAQREVQWFLDDAVSWEGKRT